MNEQQHHEQLVKGITEQMKPVLEGSGQAIYLYLDDIHKVCNKEFAELLGYESPEEWADTDAPLADVVDQTERDVQDVDRDASRHGCRTPTVLLGGSRQ